MFGLFGKKTVTPSKSGKQLVKDYNGVMKLIKKDRVKYCQNKGMSINDMGKDLAHLERKGRSFYQFAISYLKEGHTFDETFTELMTNQASSDIDRQIIEKLFGQ